jgi:surface protein
MYDSSFINKYGNDAYKDREFLGMSGLDFKWNKNYDATHIREVYANYLYRACGIMAQHSGLSNLSLVQTDKNNKSTSMGLCTVYEPSTKSFIKRSLKSEESYINMTDWETSGVTHIQSVFHTCESLTSLDVSNWDTSNVDFMKYMFYGCDNLTQLDVSNFDTSKVDNMSYMFYNCNKLTKLDVSNFDTSNVNNMSYMFYNCKNLTTLDVSNFDTSKVTDIGNMFRDCSYLTELNCSSWNISHITRKTYLGSAFNGCPSLVDFYPPQNINAEMDVSHDTKLSHDSLVRIINNLMTKTSTTKLILGATNLAKLSDEEKAIATNKGWTLS